MASDALSKTLANRRRLYVLLLLAVCISVLSLVWSSSSLYDSTLGLLLTPADSTLGDDACVALPQDRCVGGVPPRSQLQGVAAMYICRAMRQADSGVLIFGTGFDSPMWLNNTRAKTVFLERHREWVSFQPKDVQQRTELVQYTTVLRWPYVPWQPVPPASHFALFMASLPLHVRSRQWDVILVDSPEGADSGDPGRSQSIFAARSLLRKGGIVFVDDYDRYAERRFVAEFFGGFRRQVFSNGHRGQTVALCSGT